MSHTILIVDDEVRMADVLAAALGDHGYRATVASSAPEALNVLEQQPVDLVLTDLRLPHMDGHHLLREVRRLYPELPVVAMTAYTSVRDAVQLIKEGAFDYIPKPFEIAEAITIIGRALQIGEVIRDNARLRSELEERYSFEQLIGNSTAFRKVLNQIAEVSSSRATVLITGESGTGKELVSRAIHFNSPRRSKPFVVVNCAAVPEGLLESELFGHAKGAFTGAISSRQGRFAAADGGSLFLDEIGDMPMAIQAKVLRVLQQKAFEPVGSTRTVEVDVRIVAATHKDLRRSVEEGAFRQDLFYRLNVYPIELPPLRHRGDDVQILASHFLRQHAESMGKKLVGFTPAARSAITAYRWPGNVRELENCIERAVIVAGGSTIDLPDLPPYVFEHPSRLRDRELPPDLDAALAGIEKEFILRALREMGGVQVRAAERLGINERSLWHRIKKLGITITKAAAP